VPAFGFTRGVSTGVAELSPVVEIGAGSGFETPDIVLWANVGTAARTRAAVVICIFIAASSV
jgi:hypothetical protein